MYNQPFDLEEALAVSITSVTLLGVLDKEYPYKRGNCFGIRTNDNRVFKIVNFVHENIEEAMRRGVEFPIKILIIGDGRAIIHDERIPGDWYRKEWCITCCPNHLLPLPQRLVTDLRVKSGELSYFKINESLLGERHDPSKKVTLPPREDIT